MPTKTRTTVDLSEHYDADTLRNFTTEQYETRKRLYAERDDARRAAEDEYNRGWADRFHNPSFDQTVSKWPALEPLVRKYLDLDYEIKRIDREELPQEDE